METSLLSIKSLSKRFGGQAALSNVSLEVGSGEFVALLGPSGCGKTTLLRCIAGFLTPDDGSIRLTGEDVTTLPPYRRPLNTVFQNYALFPHMSVLDNVAYGPRRKGVAKEEAANRAQEALELVGLSGYGDRFPRELSGGQQQRVALARAIVNKPKLLLLDEPLSALDLKLRKRVQIELKHLQAKLGIAFVFVTHDQEEALTMADRVVVMNNGRIEQIDRGDAIYRAPATRFVADFIGDANLITCSPRADGRLQPELGSLSLDRGNLPSGSKATAVLRPEDVALLQDPETPGFSTIEAIVEDVIGVGSYTLINMRANGALFSCRISGDMPDGLRPGAPVVAGFRPERLHLIADATP